jgi:hypothetical protein
MNAKGQIIMKRELKSESGKKESNKRKFLYVL